MSNTPVVINAELPVVDSDPSVPHQDDTFLVARNQMEMQSCQSRMLEFFTEQILVCKRNEQELREAIDVAKRSKWSCAVLGKQLKYSLERKEFLVKCKKAVEAGYAIIPDMPCEVFAIRVHKKDGPSYDTADTTKYSNRVSLPDQTHDQLPAGEGDYVSPRPVPAFSQTVTKKDYNNNEYKASRYYAKDFKPVQFPVIAARTRIMEATESALTLRVFDELAVAPPRRKPDPMILGRIYGPRRSKYAENVLTFIVCWFLDLKELER